MNKQEILSLLNAPSAKERLGNLRKIISAETEKPVARPEFANNHIHTT